MSIVPKQCVAKFTEASHSLRCYCTPLVCHQELLCKYDSFTPNKGAEYKGGSDFRPICGYISETVIDRGIFTTVDKYIVVRALSNGAAFDDLE